MIILSFISEEEDKMQKQDLLRNSNQPVEVSLIFRPGIHLELYSHPLSFSWENFLPLKFALDGNLIEIWPIPNVRQLTKRRRMKERRKYWRRISVQCPHNNREQQKCESSKR